MTQTGIDGRSDDLVRLMWVSDPVTAAIAQDVLTRGGVESFISGESSFRLTWGSFSGAQRPALLVRRGQRDEAADLLAQAGIEV
jgi:hypothetical protein